ncbi:unnamed protein product [Prorocentrum cordatum]|uniref:Uncharacterized protein n=1 Tax=Prorocentrum cordatum TaxID=2364126 RepID=A0ABN9QFZ6_9DINO|nr:unnamed protein product [Polarella glacialis]
MEGYPQVHFVPPLRLRRAPTEPKSSRSCRKRTGMYFRRMHLHVCCQCGMPYAHLHGYFKRGHSQFPFQCPWECCQWFVGKGDLEQQKNKSRSSNRLDAIVAAYGSAKSTPQRTAGSTITDKRPTLMVHEAICSSLASIGHQGLQSTRTMKKRVALRAYGGTNDDLTNTSSPHRNRVESFEEAKRILLSKQYRREPTNVWLEQAGIDNVFNTNNESHRQDFKCDMTLIHGSPMPDHVVHNVVERCLNQSNGSLWLSDLAYCIVFESFTGHVFGAKNFSRTGAIVELFITWWRSRKCNSGSVMGELLKQEVLDFQHDNLEHRGQFEFRGEWTHNGLNAIVPGFVNAAVAATDMLINITRSGNWMKSLSNQDLRTFVDTFLKLHPPLGSLKRMDTDDGTIKQIPISVLRDHGAVEDASFGYGRGRCPAIEFSKQWLTTILAAYSKFAAEGRFVIMSSGTRRGLVDDIKDVRIGRSH